MNSGNPVLTEKAFQGFDVHELADSNVMTVKGTANKTTMLLVLVVIAAMSTWYLFTQQNPIVMPLMWGGMIGGLALAIATSFKPTWARITTPMYAVAEGLFLGGISAMIQAAYPKVPIVFQAVCLTFGTMFAMLIAYNSGWIRATEKFKLGVVAATGGICLLYFISMIMRFFNMSMPFLHDASPIGIGISVVIVIVAALNLILDFDFIEAGAARGAPKYMEWYAAFGLLVTLVWLYIEFLRLLSKLNSRD